MTSSNVQEDRSDLLQDLGIASTRAAAKAPKAAKVRSRAGAFVVVVGPDGVGKTSVA